MVPNLDHEPGLSRAEVQAKIEAHFRQVATGLPFWKRVRTLEFWDGELPRTSSRKIKRREVAEELRRRHQKSKTDSQQSPEAHASEAGMGWFLEIVANACGKAPYEIHMQSRVDELGFDSLTFTEFAAALEAADVHVPEGVVFTGAVDVAALYDLATGKRHPSWKSANRAGPTLSSTTRKATSSCPRRCSVWASADWRPRRNSSTRGRCRPRCGGKATSRSTPTSSWRPTTRRTSTWAR